jgi:hypothetical protein
LNGILDLETLQSKPALSLSLKSGTPPQQPLIGSRLNACGAAWFASLAAG